MTDTCFAAGVGVAYVTDHVIALSDEPGVDVDVMALCVSGDWNVLAAAAASCHLAALVVHDAAQVRLGVRGDASVEVGTADGVRRFDGTDVWTTEVVDGAHHVTLVSNSDARMIDPDFRVDGGVVPASIVKRRLGAPIDADADPFDVLFGHTVSRTVEEAAVRGDDGSAVRRANLGVLVFSTGDRVVVDTDVMLGRNPQPVDGANERRPRLVKLSHPGVSRRHAVIRLDRWRATIEDLGSANGTTVASPGRAAEPLVHGTPVELAVGAVVDLGGHVSFSVEEAA